MLPAPLLATDVTKEATLYRDPNCGCCGEHARYLRQHGYTVRIVPQTDINAIKRQYGVPERLASCHTTLIGDYVVEGHVPITAIRKLMKQRPDITGIALPGMPIGSPGMPGPKEGVFMIYAFSKDGIRVFATE
jgi:hypothetical protein